MASPPRARWLAAGIFLTAALVLAPAAPARAQLERAPAEPPALKLQDTFQELAPELLRATVLVTATNNAESKMGYGSGAVISPDGWVLTCAHVVDFADELEVTLADGRTYVAERTGMNTKQDYALLRLNDARDLPVLPMGDSSTVKLGDWVAAAGHPGGPYPDLAPSFSVGRVTGLHRRLPVQMMDRYYDDGIRTDAPIFAGNSGGPLVDLEGRLIGLNGAILLLNENSYAVPINEIKAHLELMKSGTDIAGRAPTGLALPLDEFKGEDLVRFGTKFLRKGLGSLFAGPNGEPNEMTRMVDRLGKTLEQDEMVRTILDAVTGSEDGDVAAIRETLEALLGDGGGNGDSTRELIQSLGELFGQEPPDPNGDPAADALTRLLEGLLNGGQNEGDDLIGTLLDALSGRPPTPDGDSLEQTLETMSSAEVRELIETTDATALRRMVDELGPERLKAIVGRMSPDDVQALLSGPRGPELQALLLELETGAPAEPRAEPRAETPPAARPQARPEQPRPDLPAVFIGIQPDLDSDAAQRIRGVLLERVVEGGPAAKAGLRKGDVIVEIEGVPIGGEQDLARVLKGREPEQTVAITVLRADPKTGVPMAIQKKYRVRLEERGDR